MEISRLVKKHRLQLGLTQSQLAARAGIPVNTVESIEQGLRRPSVETAKKLAPALMLHWTEFFDDCG